MLILEKKQTACKAYLDAKSMMSESNIPEEHKSHLETNKLSKENLGEAGETLAF